MGKPLTIQEEDDKQIEKLKKKTGATTKIAVLRMALALLEQEVERQGRVKRWQKAVKLAADESAEINADFRRHSRIKRT
jgi:hypothetical protein